MSDHADLCTYCGQLCSGIGDHLFPISSTGIPRKSQLRRDVVPCCSECNTLLGSFPFNTVQKRAAFLADKLVTRYQKLLLSPDWNEDDLFEVSNSLRKIILSAQKEKSHIIDRVAHAVRASKSLKDQNSDP